MALMNPDWQKSVQQAQQNVQSAQQQYQNPVTENRAVGREVAPAPAPAPAPAAPAPAAQPAMGSKEWVQQYYDSRGVKPRDTSVQYWADKWNEFGQKDPEYYQRFLSNAEEFTGGAAQTAKAMWGIDPSSGGSPGGGGTYGSSFSMSGPTSWLTDPSGKANSLYDTLMNRAGQSLNINGRDPIIAHQVNAFRAEQDRSVRNQLAQAAEAGGPNANLNSERRLLNERAAQSTGGMQANLIQNELNARRQEIAQSLAQAGGMLSDEQRIGLQKELGLIDANLRQQGITNQNNQFLDSLGLQSADRASYWDMVRRNGGSF